MSLKVPKSGNAQLFKECHKHLSGLEDAVLRNIQAISELSDLVRTKFGQMSTNVTLQYGTGRNKLIVNHLGKLFVTSDAATIIRELYPLRRTELMIARQMGDTTNLVLIPAGELLKEAESLLVMGLHPSEMTAG